MPKKETCTCIPGAMIIRVIRVTANDSWEDCVRSIATKQDVPNNIYTLWICEDVPMCGRFNPLNPSLSAIEQLLDKHTNSFVDTLLEHLGVPQENIFRPSTSDTEESEESSADGGDKTQNDEVALLVASGRLWSVFEHSASQVRPRREVSGLYFPGLLFVRQTEGLVSLFQHSASKVRQGGEVQGLRCELTHEECAETNTDFKRFLTVFS